MSEGLTVQPAVADWTPQTPRGRSQWPQRRGRGVWRNLLPYTFAALQWHPLTPHSALRLILGIRRTNRPNTAHSILSSSAKDSTTQPLPSASPPSPIITTLTPPSSAAVQPTSLFQPPLTVSASQLQHLHLHHPMSPLPHFLSLPLLLLLLSLATVPASAAVGLTLGLLSLNDGPSPFYLHHFNLSHPPSALTPVSPTSPNSTILFLNDNDAESLIFAPPTPPSSTEWLIPLQVEAGGVLLHFDPSIGVVQVDQVHPSLTVHGTPGGTIQQLLWSDTRQFYYGLVVDDDNSGGDLFVSVYEDVVNEVLANPATASANVTLSVGDGHQVELMEQSTAISQRRQVVFLLTTIWDEDVTTLGLVWALNLTTGTLSKPIAYNPNTWLWAGFLAYSEHRDALYAVVPVWDSTGSRVERLLVDRVDWVTGNVTHVVEAVPIPDAGLDCLAVTLDDDRGELYLAYRSMDPEVEGYTLLVTVVNVDTKKVSNIVEMTTVDALMGVGLTYSHTQRDTHTQPPSASPQHQASGVQLQKRGRAGSGEVERQGLKGRGQRVEASR